MTSESKIESLSQTYVIQTCYLYDYNQWMKVGLDTDQILVEFSVFMICFKCYRYLIFRFALLWDNTDIWKTRYPKNI